MGEGLLDSSARKWRKGDGENCPAPVAFVQQLALVPAHNGFPYELTITNLFGRVLCHRSNRTGPGRAMVTLTRRLTVCGAESRMLLWSPPLAAPT